MQSNPYVAAVTPFRLSGLALPDPDTALRLDGNEEALGPSDRAVAAAAAAAADVRHYPDSASTALREAIARTVGVSPDAIICGHGSEELIFLLCRALLQPGDEVAMPASTFSIFRIAAELTGAVVVRAPERQWACDIDALLASITPRTRIVIVANPNNPTGACVRQSELERLRDSLPDDVLLIVDAAYAEYVDDPDYSAGHALVQPDGPVVVLRTFSKAHALAGLRVGWAHAPTRIVDLFNRVRPVFNLSSPAAAAAVASLQDVERLQRVRTQARAAARGYQALWDGLGVYSVQGAANFTFAVLAEGRGRDLAPHLAARNILIASLGGYGLPDAVRISFAGADDNARVQAEIRAWANG